jgi:tyrosyl-tRNA synthetase
MKIDTNPEKIERLLTRGVTEVIDKEHLRAQLSSGKQLRVKLGFDPTGAKIHIGRAIILRKLREFQDLGHKAIFLVGDFTVRIVDPSDNLDKRPKLSDAQIKENLKNYKAQVGKIIDLRKAEFKFNSAWLKKLKFADVLDLQRAFTTNQMMTRRNFSERIEKGGEVGLEETSYPLMQGYDSVALKADVEIGGFDQLFNLKAGRVLQRHFGMPAQDILTGEMLEGTDGRKMSTSWGNVINITDEPNDMFGKVMAIKDELVDKHFKLCTDLSDETVAALPTHPKERKLRLAYEIVMLYHGKVAAEKAQAAWEAQFSKGEKPAEIAEIRVSEHAATLAELLVIAQLADSKSEARRLIEQGGVRVNDVKKTDPNEVFDTNTVGVIQVGPRRFVRVTRK